MEKQPRLEGQYLIDEQLQREKHSFEVDTRQEVGCIGHPCSLKRFLKVMTLTGGDLPKCPYLVIPTVLNRDGLMNNCMRTIEIN